jgi:hypothetical protein
MGALSVVALGGDNEKVFVEGAQRLAQSLHLERLVVAHRLHLTAGAAQFGARVAQVLLKALVLGAHQRQVGFVVLELVFHRAQLSECRVSFL